MDWWQVLRGFQKVTLAPKAKATVVFPLDAGSTSVWHGDGWKRVGGTFGVMVGSSSRDIRLRGSLDVVA